MNGSLRPHAHDIAVDGDGHASTHLLKGRPGEVPAGGERGAGRAHRPTQLSTGPGTVTAS